jgi:hypothetical protein
MHNYLNNIERLNCGAYGLADNINIVWVKLNIADSTQMETFFYKNAFDSMQSATFFVASLPTEHGMSDLRTGLALESGDFVESIGEVDAFMADNPAMFVGRKYVIDDLIAISARDNDEQVSFDFWKKSPKKIGIEIDSMFSGLIKEAFEWTTHGTAEYELSFDSNIKTYLSKGNEAFIVYVEAENENKEAVDIFAAKTFDLKKANLLVDLVSSMIYHHVPKSVVDNANNNNQQSIFPKCVAEESTPEIYKIKQ